MYDVGHHYESYRAQAKEVRELSRFTVISPYRTAHTEGAIVMLLPVRLSGYLPVWFCTLKQINKINEESVKSDSI